MNYFVTAIGTDSGKTLLSAIICEALEADYWKPIQAGLPRDTDVVRGLISNTKSALHPEQYLFEKAASPHAAAVADQTTISSDAFRLPETGNILIIEGAGGCLVPLNDDDLLIDLIAPWRAEVVLISNHYLGSINHTLLTMEALKQRNLPIKGLIFNGDTNSESERIILRHTQAKVLLRVKREPEINREVVKKYATRLKANWNG